VGVVIEELPELGVAGRVSRWCFNCYVIAGDDGSLVVVDPGLPSAADDLAPLLARVSGVVRAVTATHGHPDHVGGAGSVAARHNAPIHLPSMTMSYLDGVRPRSPSIVTIARTIWKVLLDQPFDRKAVAEFASASATAGFGTPRGMLWRGPRPVGGLDDGMQLPWAAAWTVLSTPVGGASSTSSTNTSPSHRGCADRIATQARIHLGATDPKRNWYSCFPTGCSCRLGVVKLSGPNVVTNVGTGLGKLPEF
jgi:glyoxylase-like metal-dependent hydrolase (beta-lactamase superfamily II)